MTLSVNDASQLVEMIWKAFPDKYPGYTLNSEAYENRWKLLLTASRMK